MLTSCLCGEAYLLVKSVKGFGNLESWELSMEVCLGNISSWGFLYIWRPFKYISILHRCHIFWVDFMWRVMWIQSFQHLWPLACLACGITLLLQLCLKQRRWVDTLIGDAWPTLYSIYIMDTRDWLSISISARGGNIQLIISWTILSKLKPFA